MSSHLPRPMIEQHSEDDDAHALAGGAPLTPSPSLLRSPVFWLAAAVLAVGIALLLVLVLRERLALVVTPGSGAPVFLGRVQRVRYVGAPGPMTQVDLPTESLLLRDAVRLQLGTPLYLRSSAAGDWVCDAQGRSCSVLMTR